MTDAKSKAIHKAVVTIIVALLWPLAIIWGWNHLGFHPIDFTFLNWLAVLIITSIFKN
jgi:hypothetical protein